MARNAAVFFLPGKRIFDEKGKSAINRYIDDGSRRWRPIGQHESRETEKKQAAMSFRISQSVAPILQTKTPLSRLTVHVQYTAIHDAMLTVASPPNRDVSSSICQLPHIGFCYTDGELQPCKGI